MGSHVRQFGSTNVRLACDQSVDRQAAWLLDSLLPGFPPGVIAAGKRFEFGWAVLAFHPQGGDLILCEPDYDRDPRTLRPDITRSLATVGQQRDVTARVRVEPVTTRFDDTVIAARGFARHRELVLQRSEPERGISGWSISPTDVVVPDDPSAWESFMSCGLLRFRPALLQALTLPPGYLVIFHGDSIVGVADPDDNERWK